ncbi:hypothetical protein [Streptomyces buecherae]|uniref:Uncharacterized protein n=1 Tax=Streptomyces buecherae TaxID=2763006 RepID=A0A7H8NCK5_9ACTN|nr:hypothetical protein [Streptomyces buecherae]QKW51498.1 hypothetical protein HUT08_20380 [Streptomyces buecherae]
MTATRPPLRVENLGIALEALGWSPVPYLSRAATRTEMLGLLRFIVEAELCMLELDEEEREIEGYMAGLDTRARQETASDKEYAEVYLKHWANLIARGVRRNGFQSMAMLESYDTVGGAGAAAGALTFAVLQLLRIPGTREVATGEVGTPRVVRVALEKARPFIHEARQHVDHGQRELKRLGY